MTYAILFLALFMVFLVGSMCWLDSQLPTEEDEEAQGKQDMEELIRRMNEDTDNRPRVRAGKPIY